MLSAHTSADITFFCLIAITYSGLYTVNRYLFKALHCTEMEILVRTVLTSSTDSGAFHHVSLFIGLWTDLYSETQVD